MPNSQSFSDTLFNITKVAILVTVNFYKIWGGQYKLLLVRSPHLFVWETYNHNFNDSMKLQRATDFLRDNTMLFHYEIKDAWLWSQKKERNLHQESKIYKRWSKIRMHCIFLSLKMQWFPSFQISLRKVLMVEVHKIVFSFLKAWPVGSKFKRMKGLFEKTTW